MMQFLEPLNCQNRTHFMLSAHSIGDIREVLNLPLIFGLAMMLKL